MTTKPDRYLTEVLQRIKQKLEELSLTTSAIQNKGSLISQDAVQRLLQVSEKLAQLDLYAIRGRDFKWWTGEKGPLLHAFGVVDGPSLLQYLGVQLARVESLGKQADIYLSSLDVGATGGSNSSASRPCGKQLAPGSCRRCKL